MSMIDISTLETEATPIYDVPVMFADDATPIAGFKVVGKNSPQYQARRRMLSLDGVKRSAVRAKKLDTKTDDGAAELIDSVENNETQMALACVVDWYGFVNPSTLNEDALLKVFKARPSWREKVLSAIEDDANFSRG